MGSSSVPQRNFDDRDQRLASTAMGVPLTKWAIAAVSAIFVCYVAIHYGLQLNDEYQKAKQQNRELAATTRQLTQDNKVLVKSQDDVSSQSNKRVSERARHLDILHEKGVVFRLPVSSNGPAAIVTYYQSDGCIRLERDAAASGPYGISSGQDLWIPDPTRSYPTSPHSHVERSDSLSSPPALSALYAAAPQPHFSLVASVAALQPPGPYGKPEAPAVHLLPVQSGCLDPHPWPFEGKWGTAKGCVVQFWRTWKDGCQHYQLYNTCTGKWDPQIHWTQCSRRHHP